MFCSNCGQQLPDGSKFCNKCGYAVPSNTAPTQIISQSNPAVETTCADTASQPASEKKLRILAGCVSGLALVCLITLIAVLVSGPGDSKDKISESPSVESIPSTVSSDINAEEKEIPELAGSKIETENPAFPEESEPEPTDEPEQPDTPEIEDDGLFTEQQVASFVYSHNTNDFPELEDFSWFTDDILPDLVKGYFKNDTVIVKEALDRMKADGVILDDVRMWDGGWKALIVWDPEDSSNGQANVYELYNFKINTKKDNSSTLRTRSYKMISQTDHSFYDTTHNDDSHLNGSYTGSMLDFEMIKIQSSWYSNACQYAFGIANLSNGTGGYVVMQRELKK